MSLQNRMLSRILDNGVVLDDETWSKYSGDRVVSVVPIGDDHTIDIICPTESLSALNVSISNYSITESLNRAYEQMEFIYNIHVDEGDSEFKRGMARAFSITKAAAERALHALDSNVEICDED